MGLSKDWFVLDGKDSRDFGVFLFEKETLSAPARRIEKVSVPGLNGELVLEEDAYENQVLRYGAVIIKDAMEGLSSLRNFLLSRAGYVRLEDSFQRDEFYMVRMDGGVEPQTTRDRSAVRLVLEFDRKPQRFLKIGEEVKEFTAAGTLENPTWFQAKPLLRIYGNGMVAINGQTLTVANNADTYVDVDCEIKDAYHGTTNRNGDVTAPDHEFPRLILGTNQVSLSGPSKVEVTPRWWQL